MKIRHFGIYAMTAAFALTGLVGCATNKSVEQKIAAAQATTDKRVESVEGQIEQIQEKNKAQDDQITQLSQTAQDALKRAQEAGVLAKGKVVFEQTFSDDRVKFKTGSAVLSSDAKAALDEFATKVKDINEPVYIEIQGHTDNRGGVNTNDALGQRRADAVRVYLSKQHQLPLMRMSTISYGETAPVASNNTKSGRSQNRRVVLVVLQ